MAIDDRDRDELLPCGTPLETLVAQITEGEDPTDPAHQAGCEYCQLAVRELTAAWGDVQAFAELPVRAPEGLSARIMTEIRALAARVAGAAVLIGGRGNTRIAESVLAQVARRAALGVPGVAVATALSAVVDPGDRRRVRFALRLVVTFGPVLEALADLVRAKVIRDVAAQTGIEVSGIDIAIEDLISER
jgi:uncharacterized alkaline shock family protein YloU